MLQAYSLDELDASLTKSRLLLVRQMTTEKYEELVKLEEKAEIASWIFTALEILGFFAASKAITQMWSLLLTTQFVAYMIKWQISIDSNSSVVLNKLSQVVLN